MKLSRRPARRGRIEMVPLIDCMFLLLVFFIYSMLSMVLHRGIKVDLPQARTALVHQEDYLSIAVTREGEVYLDRARVTLEELGGQLRQRKVVQPDLKVFIGGDRDAHYDQVIQVMDLVRQVGISQVALETKWKEAPGTT
jgi:biopolymer transport protein ExbD